MDSISFMVTGDVKKPPIVRNKLRLNIESMSGDANADHKNATDFDIECFIVQYQENHYTFA